MLVIKTEKGKTNLICTYITYSLHYTRTRKKCFLHRSTLYFTGKNLLLSLTFYSDDEKIIASMSYMS